MIEGEDQDTSSILLGELLLAELEAFLGPAERPAASELDEPLAALWRRARAAFPELQVGPEAYVAHLARRLPADHPLTVGLSVVHAEDLYLALGCGLGDAAALSAFDRIHAEDLRLAIARVRGSAPNADDVKQHVQQRLFVGSPGTPPKILDYSGQGRLTSWYRVALVRAMLDEQRRIQGEPETDDDERILGIASPERDPELAYLREKYSHEFRLAFEEGAKALDAEDRNALRAFYSQGLTVDQLATMLGIHRATAARRVASARERLLANTRRNLMVKLQLSRAELESVMRLIQSGLSVSVHRIFL